MLTKWDKVRNYKFTELEKTIMEIMFNEYVASKPTSNSEYDAYRHGWILANISLEEPEKGK